MVVTTSKAISVKTNHLLSDVISRLNTAMMSGRQKVSSVPSSRFLSQVFNVLREIGIVTDTREYLVAGSKPFADIYLNHRAFCKLRVLSTPGRVVHVRAEKVRRYDVCVISTSSGVMTGAEAFHKGIGGKILLVLA